MRTVEIDLYRDWVAYLRDTMTAQGVDVTRLATDEKVVHAHLNLEHRRIPPAPRKILKAGAFVCPPELQSGLAALERRIEAGEDVAPYLSRQMRDPAYHDEMFNDWGIHHLHLGATRRPDGYMARTGPLLFARFDATAAYFIDILPHGSWALPLLLTTLHDNWPATLAPFRLDVPALEHAPTAPARLRLRRAGALAALPMDDGTVYRPPGGGYATSGLSLAVAVRADRLRATLRAMQQRVLDDFDGIHARARARNVALPAHCRFGVEVCEGQIVAVEIGTGYRVVLGPL